MENLCKPCLNRGRRTRATHAIAAENWCEYCAEGKIHPIDAARMRERNKHYLEEINHDRRMLRQARKAELQTSELEERPFDQAALVVWQQCLRTRPDIPPNVVLGTLKRLCEGSL